MSGGVVSFTQGGPRRTGAHAVSPIALVVEPDVARATDIDSCLRAANISPRLCADAEAAWKAFASEPPAVIFTALSTPRRDAAWLLRRMREDWLGALPPIYGMAEHDEIGPRTRDLELDGLLLRPLAGGALRSLARPRVGEDDANRIAAQLRDLYDLTLLGDDLDVQLTRFVERLALNFRVADCVLWGPAHDGRWPKTRRPPGRPEEQALTLWRCDLALSAGATIVACDAAGHIPGIGVLGEDTQLRSILAVPLDAPGARGLGALCLVDDGARRFTSEERDALLLVGRRLARELAWRSAHDRLVEDHDKLRETAQKDPLTGALSAVALTDVLERELAQSDHLAVAVVDVSDLRLINDRYGHSVGDAVLTHVVRVMEHHLRREDHIGRMAGDELAIVLPGISLTAGQALLDRLRRRIAESPLPHHGLEVPVRVRVGVTAAAGGDDAPALLERAESALKEAKRSHAHVMALAAGEEFGSARSTGLHELPETLPPVSDVLPAGTTLGGMYQILHEINRGAMGVVYRAEDLGLGRPVAVKVLRADLARDAELVTRFREEATMLANLRHENLVAVYAFGAREHDVYFVMELVEGEQLADLMQRADESGEPMAIETVGAIVTQVAGALAAMHHAGAVHRDVKPANILLDRVRERAVLVDVGVAKRHGSSGDAAGTPGFAAPESFTAGDEGPATDVYGLAAVAYMMLTGLAPFGGGDVTKVVRRQQQDRPAAPSRLRDELAEEVDRVLLRALAPRAEDRYHGAIEFAAALEQALTLPPDRPVAERSEQVSTAPPTAPGGTRRLSAPLSSTAAPSGKQWGSSRGALFRVAYKILGNRLGSAWVRRAADEFPIIADVLRPSVQPFDWFPTDRLVAVLRAVPAQIRDPRKVARELGRAAMSATFARFLGSDPAAASPEAVLAAAPDFWPRFHSWGQVSVQAKPGVAVIQLAGTPHEPLLCHWVEGAFERVVELAGATQVGARQVECECSGGLCCTFELHWAAS